MHKTIYAISNDKGELIVGGTSNSKRHSKRPHVYTNERNAKLGLRHVEQKEGEVLEIVPYVPLSDLIESFKIYLHEANCTVNPVAIEAFHELLGKYGYTVDGYGHLSGGENL